MGMKNLANNVSLDLKLSWRSVLRNRWHSAVVIILLALATGTLTAVFSVLSAVLLKPYGPIATDEWVYLWEHQIGTDGGQQLSASILNFHDWKRDTSSVFSDMVIWLPWSYTASTADAGHPQQIRAAVISPEVFTATGAIPAAGRLLSASDTTNSEHVVVLSYDFWQRAYGGNPSIVGGKISLNLVPHTVVGIAPRRFSFPTETPTDAWTPIPVAILSGGNRSSRGFRVAARLRPGVTPKAAQSAMTLVSQRLAGQYPEDKSYDSLVIPMREAVVGNFRTPLLALSGALGFTLLLACLNISYLRVVQLQSRRKEMMLRLALGASRVRLLRQLLMETLLLFGIAGALGLAISPIAIWGMISLVPSAEISWLQPRTDLATFLLMFTLTLLAGLVSGLVPALHASRSDPARTLGSNGTVTQTSPLNRRIRNAAQVAQIALALIPLCGAGLLIRSFQRLQGVTPVFDPKDRLTLMFAAPKARYPGPPEIAALARHIEEETNTIPGVRQSAVIQALPFSSGTRWFQAVTRTDPLSIRDLGQLPLARYTVATAGYFEAMGIPLKAGRTLNASDDAAAQPVVVINEQLAHDQFSNENPLGKRIWVGHAEALPGSQPRVVIGVVANTRMDSLDQTPDPSAWVPIAQQSNSDNIFRNLYLVVHTSFAPSAGLGTVRDRIRNIDPDLAISDVASMDDRLGESLWRQRFSAIVVGVFSLAALAIAVLGVFGLTSYLVANRTFEIGVRMSVGASRLDVLRLVMGQSIALALFGVGVGLLGCIATTHVLSAFLFDIKATDPFTLGAVALLLLVAASAASYLPARRAAAVNPLVALRGSSS